MLIDIIPAIKLPRGVDIFTYQIPEELAEKIKIGQIVSVPWRQSTGQGIVFKINKPEQPNLKYKKIIKIINDNILVTAEQFKFFEWISKYYFSSLGLAAKTFIPEIPKKIFNSKKTKLAIPEKTLNQKIITVNLPKDKQIFLHYKSKLDKFNFYLNLIDQAINDQRQIAIIWPEINQIDEFLAYLPNHRGQIAVLTGEINKTDYYQSWQKIIENKAKIILGTKTALGAPFVALKYLIIDNEENTSHKQWDQNPRYSARDAGIELAKILNCQIILSSASPSLETYLKIINKEFHPIVLKNAERVNTAIVDLNDEFKNHNFSPISEKLKEAIITNLDQNKPIALFLNKKGYNSHLACKDCLHEIVCPKCRLPLHYSPNSKKLTCAACVSEYPLINSCPKCRGVNFKLSGGGIEKIIEELKKIDNRVKIKGVSANDQKTTDNSFNILIGTTEIFNHSWKNFGLIGVISADTHLYIPDFRSGELTYRLLNSLVNKTLAESPQTTVIIQTRYPYHHAIGAIAANNSKIFYRQELNNRQNTGYPPFKKFVKLIYQNINAKSCVYCAKEIYNDLRKKIVLLRLKAVEISPPFAIYGEKIRGRYRYQIIIKLPNPRTDLTELLKIVPLDWIIDVDPIELN